jgi:hypothetical protein
MKTLKSGVWWYTVCCVVSRQPVSAGRGRANLDVLAPVCERLRVGDNETAAAERARPPEGVAVGVDPGLDDVARLFRGTEEAALAEEEAVAAGTDHRCDMHRYSGRARIDGAALSQSIREDNTKEGRSTMSRPQAVQQRSSTHRGGPRRRGVLTWPRRRR